MGRWCQIKISIYFDIHLKSRKEGMIPGGIMHKRMELKLRGRVLYRPNEAEIQRKENMWRLKLPLDYRQFLKEYNGGVPEKSEFKGIHSNRTYMV